MTELAEIRQRLQRDLVEEATPLPGQQLAYGRPHAHPRTRFFPSYSRTGERLAGTVAVRPDCPRPRRGRCECPPDGSWRPAVGVIRADSTAQHKHFVAGDADVVAPIGVDAWVDEIYVQGADGLWRCRWPVRRALERLRGASQQRWAIAIRILRGERAERVWGAHGAPPDPVLEATRILATIDRWATEERETEWERRPRQWWDRARRSNARPMMKSESQSVADAPGLHRLDGAATVAPTGRVSPLPRSTASDAATLEQPSGKPGARGPSGIAFPARSPEGLCA